MSDDLPDDLDPKHPLEYFHAGLPPFSIFIQSLDDIHEVVKAVDPHKDLEDWEMEEYGGLNTVAELGLIGLVAHFKAFGRHLFAALANSTPPLLKKFSNRRLQASIPIRDLIPFGPRVSENLGFIVAEHYDFGSTKNINRLFEDLVDFTPIGSDDGKVLDSMIFDRNLLTHHGGVYSMRYSHEKDTVKNERGGVYFDSLVVTSKDYFAHEDFILELARKMSKGASEALTRWIERSDDGEGMPLFDVQEYLNWAIGDKRRHED